MLGTLLLTAAVVSLATGMDHVPRNLQTEYYATATLMCEDNGNSGIGLARASDIYWIFPDGSVNTGAEITARDPKKFSVNDDIKPENLTIANVEDDDFGVYYCVVLMDISGIISPTKDNKVRVIYKGLNVDGPSYDTLIEQYKKNAIIGGIAAAVVFVVVSGSCLVYHFRFDRKNKDSDEEDDDPKNRTLNQYDNKGLDDEETVNSRL